MKFKELYKGRRSFSKTAQVVDAIKRSKKYDPSVESPEKIRQVQLLETSNQKTYLAATPKNIYKIIDDRRTDKPKVVWSRSRKKIAPNNKLKVSVEVYKSRTDKLVIDRLPEKTNLISKSLFANIDVEKAIDDLLKK